jgi:DNA-binding IscR family transcriptional regulator
VANHLLEICSLSAGGDTACTTHQQIADAVGTSREVISRTLGRLQRAGVVRTTAGYVVITNSTRLALIGRGGEDVGDGAKV